MASPPARQSRSGRAVGTLAISTHALHCARAHSPVAAGGWLEGGCARALGLAHDEAFISRELQLHVLPLSPYLCAPRVFVLVAPFPSSPSPSPSLLPSFAFLFCVITYTSTTDTSAVRNMFSGSSPSSALRFHFHVYTPACAVSITPISRYCLCTPSLAFGACFYRSRALSISTSPRSLVYALVRVARIQTLCRDLSHTSQCAVDKPSHSFLYALSSAIVAPSRTAFSIFRLMIPQTPPHLLLFVLPMSGPNTSLLASSSPLFPCPRASSPMQRTRHLLITPCLVLSCFMRDTSVAHHGLAADGERRLFGLYRVFDNLTTVSINFYSLSYRSSHLPTTPCPAPGVWNSGIRTPQLADRLGLFWILTS
ncbi:hypothetical protein MSAN_00155700 [Mycena sanguinolenta]|uniref:Uncharacterized protein n=1 Tax=Mycena sanguinolenta TaxID=230812 RepID=A0A8H6ZH76_9AGAR|nr:hypothetical protein MSAN_00155700 [Mycena sanguinolenta]